MIPVLTDAAARGTDRSRLSRHIDRQAAELANEFNPGRGFQTQVTVHRQEKVTDAFSRG